jgi:hypothetical protein
MGKEKAATGRPVGLATSEELESLMLGDEVGINRAWARMLQGSLCKGELSPGQWTPSNTKKESREGVGQNGGKKVKAPSIK